MTMGTIETRQAEQDALSEDLSRKLRSLDKDLVALSAQREVVQGRADRLSDEVAKLVAQADELAQASEVLNLLSKLSKEKLNQLVEALVTHAVSSVWGEDYEFCIETTEKRGVPVDSLVLKKGGVAADVTEGHGGGVVNIVAFVLRLIFILRARPTLRKVVFLDEPFAFVSEDYLPAVGELLQGLVEKLGIDILMVSHEETLMRYADRLYRLKETPNGVVAELDAA